MTIDQKIKKYREKSGYSQETLAEKMNVSRQTITKWEAGTIPQIDYLIQLSDLFGITLDMLVREDECTKKEKSPTIDKSDWTDFLIKAKQHTYAAKMGKVTSSRTASQDYQFKEGDYLYLDSFLGSEKFSGTEAIWFQDQPLWSMNYYGYVMALGFSGDFLKESLLHVPYDQPFRGPQLFQKGDYTYHCQTEGDSHCFHGKEEIFFKDKKVYELYFYGGDLL